MNSPTELGQLWAHVLPRPEVFIGASAMSREEIRGLIVPEDRIWTSALATADFLKQQQPVFVELELDPAIGDAIRRARQAAL